MPTETELLAAERTAATAATVEIASVATAVPEHRVSQADATERAQKFYPQFARLDALYTNTGIETRYSVEPVPWHLTTHTWEERTQSYQRNALDLMERVAEQAVAEAGLSLRDIDTIVTNTITGLSVPSLEARLMNRLAFRPDVERLPIFGLGCGGGVGGLARATRMAEARPGTNVLFLTVDLCSLCLRINDPSLAMFVSGALFGDGAAAVVLRSTGGDKRGKGAPARGRVGGIGEYFWSKTEHIMGWDIKNDGFGIVLSPELPTLMRERLGEALFPFLAREGLSLTGLRRLPAAPGRQQGSRDRGKLARAVARSDPLLLAGLEELRQHVLGNRAVRAQGGARRQCARPLPAGGFRSGLFRLFHRARALSSGLSQN